MWSEQLDVIKFFPLNFKCIYFQKSYEIFFHNKIRIAFTENGHCTRILKVKIYTFL